jgi:hypothetical protein
MAMPRLACWHEAQRPNCERANITARNDRKARDRTASEGTRFDVSVDADGAHHLRARSADV